MASVPMTVELLTPGPVIERRLKETIATKINLSVRLAMPKIQDKVADLLEDSIRNSHEVAELLDGDLRHQLGATKDEATATVNYLIDILKRTIRIEFTPMRVFGGRFNGQFSVSCFPNTIIDDLINYPKASFLTKKGVKIPWMEWLLTLGDRIIVKKYEIDYLHTRGSRTGEATMKPARVRGWRVPSAFSGTRRDNFITRALDDIAEHIGYIMRAELYNQI